MASLDFPEEVIIEILSWVPVKSLMRFKCVSKPWLHLISADPSFMKLHFNHSFHTNNSNPGILVSCKEGVQKTEFYYSEDYTTTSDELIRFGIPFSHPHYSSFISFSGIRTDFNVANVCNGLVCLTDYYQGDQTNAYVWNPLTGDHIRFPCTPSPTGSGDRTENGILYHKCDIMYGFGFNQAGDEYKVIRFVSASPFDLACGRLSHASVYTLGTDSSWRTLKQFIPLNISPFNSGIALVNGALHWIGVSPSKSVGMYSHQTIIAFDIQHEIFQEIPQPVGITSDYNLQTKVAVLGGMLSIFYNYQHEYVEIWVMDEYGVADSWRRLCKIEQPKASPRYDYWTPLGVADNGEIIISKNTWEWISYDSNTNTVQDLHRFEFQVYDIQTFKGSLLSPTLINKASSASHMID